MRVHWWHTRRLAEDLAKDAVTERQSFWYAVMSTLIYYQTLYCSVWFGGYRSWLLLLEFAVVLVVAFIGLQECYKANGGPSGKHFLKRLYCLGAPIGLKLAIAGVLTGAVMYYGFPRVVTPDSFRDPYFVWQLSTLFLGGLFAVIYFWRIAYFMGLITRSERSNHLMQPTGEEQPAAD